MADTLFSFLPFPRVFHVSEYQHRGPITVLEACKGFSKVQTPSEVHVAFPSGLVDHERIQQVLAVVPNVNSLILPTEDLTSDYKKVSKVLKASKTLAKVIFVLLAWLDEDWASSSALDVGLGTGSSLSSVGLRIDGILNQSAVQVLENLLFNKCLSSLSINVYGDLQESLAQAFARGLAGKVLLSSLICASTES